MKTRTATPRSVPVTRATSAASAASAVSATSATPTRPDPQGQQNRPAAPSRQPRAARVSKEQAILQEALAQFARVGFEGATLESIGAGLGISRHALLYYFPSKEKLYQRVLDEVLQHWLQGMGELAQAQDPALALKAYIAAKLRSSQERPDGSRVFTQEVMSGAPHYGATIVQQVLPVLQADVRAFERWARQGRVRRVDFKHLLFNIWAMTQAYADHAPQFALLLGKTQLQPADFRAAQQVIEAMVLALLLPSQASVQD